jgi:exodeoxyribonuclease V alpha subunit
MQDRLNPEGERAAGNPFRVGDKIVCTKNGWYEDAEAFGQASHYVANGEIGTVIDVEPRVTIATFDEPWRTIRILHAIKARNESDDDDDAEVGTGCDFDLGYAITCHKAQGSEWHTVVVLIDDSPGARRVCTREWLYTAISRASKQCITIGQRDVMAMMARRVSLDKRKTFLREIIQGC